MSGLHDPTQQAGGGHSEKARTMPYISSSNMQYLKNIFTHNGQSAETWDTAAIARFFTTSSGVQVPASLAGKTSLTFAEFLTYIASPDAAVTEKGREGDYSWPLASYFVSSSHNTYLTGNQLSSDSSVDAYRNVLLRGCRCVEIDVWDGEDTNDLSSVSSSDDDNERAHKLRVDEHKKKTEKKEKSGGFLGKLKKVATLKSDKTEEVTKQAENMTLEGKLAAPEADIPAPLPEPRVLHGYTLTKEIFFRDVCTAIAETAFVTSTLPVIVSLEVHCSSLQQQIMVNIMKETWGDMLLPPPAEEPSKLPAPGNLRNKLIVKVKYAPPVVEGVAEVPEELTAEESEMAVTGGKQVKPSKIIQELSTLGFMCRGISFKGLEQKEAQMPTHIFSLSEKAIAEHHQKNGKEMLAHNANYLMRTYPHGLRIRSGNLEPGMCWRRGAQVVALNWQNLDEGMMLNEAMFAGSEGYVLKPPGYRSKGPGTQMEPLTRYTYDFRLQIYGAQNIPLPPGDKSDKGFKPYIKIELHAETPEERASMGISISNEDDSLHEASYKVRTETRKGSEADFEGQELEFKGVKGVVEELTFLRFTVRDNEIGTDDLAAWAAVRLDRVREGWGWVHLLDSEGMLTQGVVLVRVWKNKVKEE